MQYLSYKKTDTMNPFLNLILPLEAKKKIVLNICE